jgi:hypothetical protein
VWGRLLIGYSVNRETNKQTKENSFPKVDFGCLEFFPLVEEVIVAILDLQRDGSDVYCGFTLFLFSSFPQNDEIVRQATIISCHILSNSLFAYYLLVRHYII